MLKLTKNGPQKSTAKQFKRETPPVFKNPCMIRWLRCKLSRSEWFGVKCFVLEKLAESELFTVEVIGTRRRKASNASVSSLTEGYDMKWV